MSTTVRARHMTLRPQPVAASIDELIAGAVAREPFDKNADSLSGSSFERVVIDGRPHVLKHLHVDDDWIQRMSGDLYCRPALAWRSGLLAALPPCIDHATVGVAMGLGRNGWGAAVLMRDVSDAMLDVAAGHITTDQHLRFVDHMAQLHAAFLGFRDPVGLMPPNMRYALLSPALSDIEQERGGTDPVPQAVRVGWDRVAAEAPLATRLARRIHDDPAPLVAALAATPSTLVHSDWKAGNLGCLPDGRTVLLDWAFPGQAPPCDDIAWYIAVNCDLLPVPKQEVIDAYRDALQRHGVDTAGWFEAQLDLSLIGAYALLGWSKTGEELAWWEDRVTAAAKRLP